MSDAADRLPARDRTRAVLLGAIRAADGITRGGLVASTGLPASTVTHAVSALIESGAVVESEPVSKGPGSGRGRPGKALHPAPSGRHLAAIDVGHTHVAVAIADEHGALLGSDRVALDADLDAATTLDGAARLLDSLRTSLGVGDVAACVAGIPLPVDASTGTVRASAALGSWDGIDPRAALERLTGIPTHVENDAVLAALGESSRGAGRGRRAMLYIKASHGIGAAMVIDGHPYRGASGIAGDIGHTKVSGRNDLCRCGDRGCIEATVSLGALRGQLAHTHGARTVDLEDPDAVDDVTVRLLTEAGRALGSVLAPVSNMLNPDAIVVGGELAVQPALLAGLALAMRELARPAIAAQAEVTAGVLGSGAEIAGALELACRRVAAAA